MTNLRSPDWTGGSIARDLAVEGVNNDNSDGLKRNKNKISKETVTGSFIFIFSFSIQLCAGSIIECRFECLTFNSFFLYLSASYLLRILNIDVVTDRFD